MRESLALLLLSVYGVYARSQSDTSKGTFDYDTVKSYDVSIQCTDGIDVVTQKLVVNLIENQDVVDENPDVVENQGGTSLNGTNNSWYVVST